MPYACGMDDDFETVAITYSQPEAAVMLSFLAWHEVRAYSLGEHARVSAHLVTALGGIPVRVLASDAARARALLAGVAPAEPPVVRPAVVRNPLLNAVALVVGFVFGGPPPPPRVRSDLL